MKQPAAAKSARPPRSPAKTSTTDRPFAPPQWPAASVMMWPLAKIIPYPKNARHHPPEQIEALAKAMRDDGVTTAILVDEEGVIIYGHGRRLAAIECGFTEYPVMIARGWTEAQKRAARIKDNQLALMASWNEELLKLEVVDLKIEGFELERLGFTLPELSALLDVNPGHSDPEVLPPPPKKPVVRLGDLWVLGRHRILCGDSTKAEDVARVLAGKKPRLMVTDPPYGVNYNPMWREGLAPDMNGATVRVEKAGKVVNRFRANATGAVRNDDRADWTETWKLFEGDVAYVWHGGLHSSVVEISLANAGFQVRAQIIWAKQNQVFSRGDYHWQHEPCWYAVRKGGKGWWAGDRKQTTVWQIQNHNPMGGNRDEEQTGHGTQKPIECMKRPIENNSKPGDFVYEPFAGSSTTVIACEMTGRACLAIELDPAYVQLGIERWETFTKQKATLDGKTLDEVRKERARAPRNSRKPVSRSQPAGTSPQ